MFVSYGDRAMPSIALTMARFADTYHMGEFGKNLFANVVFDLKQQSTRLTTTYFDCEDAGKEGGNVRLLAGSPAWYVDKMIVQVCAGSSAEASQAICKHINFLCSIRSQPLQCIEDQIWYRIIHVRLLGRVRRPGRTMTGGLDVYDARLEIEWRPMSAKDSDYAAVTGIVVE